jgi:hypothetical protein
MYSGIAKGSTVSQGSGQGSELGVAPGSLVAGAGALPADPPISHLGALPLVQLSDLTYIDEFSVPDQDGNGNPLSYGGHALSYNPVNHSLFFGGHDWYQELCEIAIPSMIDPSQSATIIQNCADVTEGRLGDIDEGSIKLGGTLIHSGRLIISSYSYYDADGSQSLSHFASSTDLAQSRDVQGPFQVGDWAGIVSGYMAPIPAEWQADFDSPALTGNCCLSIISRTSYGPAVSAFDPEYVGLVNPVPSTPLLYYPDSHPLASWDATGPLFNGTTHIVGIAFPPMTRSVLFFGRHGLGEFCYGSGAACNDPVNPYQGTHAYPYVHQVWAYDALDLLAVKDGTLQPWEVQPYGVWELAQMDSSGGASISGAAYDPGSGRVYITEGYGENPAVHVFQINVPGSPALAHSVYLPTLAK